MKKNITLLTMAFMFMVISVKAQITLEQEYAESVSFAYLEGNCYYSIDFANNQCIIYELGHDLKKSVNISIPADWYLNDVAFVSSNIFNEDDLTELLVVYYMYEPLTDSTGYYVYQTKVINENGLEILNVPGGGYSNIVTTTMGELKLMVYIYDFSVFPFSYSTKVYNLPGESSSSVNEGQAFKLLDAFPNPAALVVNIPYHSINNNVTDGVLIISDMNGKVIRSIRIGNTSGQVQINTGGLKAGSYLYHINSPYSKTETKKLIVK